MSEPASAERDLLQFLRALPRHDLAALVSQRIRMPAPATLSRGRRHSRSLSLGLPLPHACHVPSNWQCAPRRCRVHSFTHGRLGERHQLPFDLLDGAGSCGAG
jgi:hypothetical protein